MVKNVWSKLIKKKGADFDGRVVALVEKRL
jgi:hypothetical protein